MSADSRSEDPTKDRPQRRSFVLRLPPELHEELRRWAQSEVRSLNGHVEFLLRDAVRRHRGSAKKDEAPPSPRPHDPSG